MRWKAWPLILLSVVTGCGPDQPGLEQRVLAQRFIEEDPDAYLDRAALFEPVDVEAWSFRRVEDLSPWQPQKFDQKFELGADGLMLQSSKRHPRLRREVDWQAENVDALVLEVPGFARGVGRLYWAGEGEKLSEERSLTGRLGDGRPLPLIFDLVFHPLWRGHIRQVAIELYSPKAEGFRLRRVRAVRYQPVADAVAEAAARPWKIDLDHEVRNGMLALPGTPSVRQLEIPPKAVLRVGFGTETGARQQIIFSGVLEADGEASTVFEIPIGPEPESPRGDESGLKQAGRWHDHEVDLAPYAGADVNLRLEARVAEGEHELVHGLAFWANPEVLRPASAPPSPNVVLISIDTLRADHLALYGYGRETTPELDRWARRRASIFTNTVAPSPWTIPSHVSMFSGLNPLRHGVNHPVPIPDRLPMMAELFRDAGYATMAVTGGGFMQPRRGFSQGFDRYRYWPEAKSEDELEDGVGRALGWVDEVDDRPFMLFFHTYEVHYPFRRREPFFSELTGGESVLDPEIYLGLSNLPAVPDEGFLLSKAYFWKPKKEVLERSPASEVELGEIVDRYDSGIAYADSLLARLLTRLEEGGLDRRTVVVVTSDHGEGLGEQGLAGHAYLYDWNLLVPLLIATPEGDGGQHVETQVRTVDLLPTVTELAGLEVPDGLDGESLVPLLEGREAAHPPVAWSYVSFSNRGLAMRLDNRFKYFYNNSAWSPLHGREQLYDLRRDPLELDNLAGTSRDVAALRQQVRSRLVAITAALEVRFTNTSRRAFSGRIAGGAVHQAMVKAAALPAGALVWRQEGSADFKVLPGEDFRLWLERSAGTLALTGAFTGAFDGSDEPDSSGARETRQDSFSARLNLTDLKTPWQLSHGVDGWTQDPDAASAPVETGIVIQWRGGADAGASSPTGVDPQLAEQLRALGYIP